MLTGDKGETAHTIAISCGLIDDKYDKVFNIENPDKNEITTSIQMIK
jgi:magnesium-transporting ATPase (P-type)